MDKQRVTELITAAADLFLPETGLETWGREVRRSVYRLRLYGSSGEVRIAVCPSLGAEELRAVIAALAPETLCVYCDGEYLYHGPWEAHLPAVMAALEAEIAGHRLEVAQQEQRAAEAAARAAAIVLDAAERAVRAAMAAEGRNATPGDIPW